MKIEHMDKGGYPRTYRCNVCQAFTIVEKSGLTKRYDPDGKLFTAKPKTSSQITIVTNDGSMS